ncbi:MAG: hypothetical protein ACK5KU_01960 [Beutenbergiaceae bacterium]
MPALLETPFTATGLPDKYSTGGTLSFTNDELAHALFTTGRAPADQARHGRASLWEFVHRASLVPAYLRRTSTGALGKSALAHELDPSEKAALSYALGQAMTAIYCRQELDVSFLMHVDRYAIQNQVSFGSGRGRPDLFGMMSSKGTMSSNDWVVAEAKGRSNGMERGLPAQLAAQKSMIKTINGQQPKVAVGCISSFPVQPRGTRDQLHVDVVDPPPESEAVGIEIDLKLFRRAYYLPFVLAADAGERVSDLPGYRLSRFPGLGLQVGLRSSIHDLVVQNTPMTAELLNSALEESRADERPDRIGFSDGTFVQTSWADALAIED